MHLWFNQLAMVYSFKSLKSCAHIVSLQKPLIHPLGSPALPLFSLCVTKMDRFSKNLCFWSSDERKSYIWNVMWMSASNDAWIPRVTVYRPVLNTKNGAKFLSRDMIVPVLQLSIITYITTLVFQHLLRHVVTSSKNRKGMDVKHLSLF